MKKLFLFFAITFLGLNSFSQVSISGRVIDSETGNGIPSAVVGVKNSDINIISQSNGAFTLEINSSKAIELAVSCLGYTSQVVTIHPHSFGEEITVSLDVEIYELQTVVVTATRSERKILEVPQRVEVVSSNKIKGTPALSADAYLYSIPGISISRGASIFGTADVSMRGMGNEAGRTLIMVDGVPLNKSDGGTVNWNAINTEDVKQVEVLKGSGSTIHGGNAMGGVINLITPTPTKNLQGYVSQSYGNLATIQAQANISGLKDKLYWAVNGNYRKSDGYITNHADEVDEFSVISFLNEYNTGAKVGYKFSEKHKIDLSGGYYSGQRGVGSNYAGYGFINEELVSEKGTYNWYTGISSRISYQGTINENSNLKLNFYTQRENYEHVRENLRGNTVTKYDVLSVRDDIGFLSGYNFSLGKHNKITAGVDMRYGAVDGADRYVTSTDEVYNLGKMNLVGVYLLDEVSIGETPFSLLGGIRYDYAKFYDGKFLVENPTNETAFLQDFSGELADADFAAFSPRLSAQYYQPKKIRAYVGYSKGYRTPVLDDMCRTGRISGAMKIANPLLKPEYIDNFEVGADILYFEKISLSTSLFYSIGKDYHAYISTGDSIHLNNRLRPIMAKSNIGEVEILGAELSMNLTLSKNFSWSVAYSHIVTNILEYKRSNIQVEDDLVGSELVYQPRDIFNTSLIWRNSIVNTSAAFNYKGAQWKNEVNTEKIEGYYFIDLQLWRPVYKGLIASVMVHNLFDNEYIDSRNMVSPGRMMSFQLKYEF
ncbi:MAG TPA: TonB-dependent receptor [Perlabentimonas sp.]|nr:TonB-dependent receptor [Perlabentimonas sp.]